MTSNFLAPDIRSVFSIDLRGLALFRIALGIILVADLLIRAPDLVLWLSDEGVALREWIIQWNNDWRFSCILPMAIGCGRLYSTAWPCSVLWL